MGKLIAVVGVSGVGKTSLVRAMGAAVDFQLALEQHVERPFQTLAKDNAAYTLANQLDYFQFRAAQEQALRAGLLPALVDGGLDLDFHGFTQLFRERGRLSHQEFDLCHRVYSLIRELLPPPELFVQLTASTEIIYERLAGRERINIAAADDSELLDELMSRWLKTLPPGQVLRLDVSDEDLGYARTIELVLEKL